MGFPALSAPRSSARPSGRATATQHPAQRAPRHARHSRRKPPRMPQLARAETVPGQRLSPSSEHEDQDQVGQQHHAEEHSRRVDRGWKCKTATDEAQPPGPPEPVGSQSEEGRAGERHIQRHRQFLAVFCRRHQDHCRPRQSNQPGTLPRPPSTGRPHHPTMTLPGVGQPERPGKRP